MFWALLTLIVPLLIHWWSKGAGARLQVGSLRFLEATERRQFRVFRLTQLPLLVLRLLLLSVLVLLLGQPFWMAPTTEGNEITEHWGLVHPAVMGGRPSAVGERAVDSLATTGATMRLLVPGLPLIDREGSTLSGTAPVDVWSLLREADARLPGGSRITIIGPRRLVDMRGARPVLHAAFEWIDTEQTAPNRWLQTARWITADSLQVTVGLSRPTGTHRATYRVEAGREGAVVLAQGLGLDVRASRAWLQPEDAFPQDDTLAIAPTGEALRVALHPDGARSDDARYVRAAVQAVAEAAHRPVEVTTVTDTTYTEADVVFWLRTDAIPEAWADRIAEGLVLVSDATGDAWKKVQRRVLIDTPSPGEPPLLTQRMAPTERGVVLWRDSAGEPLLEQEQAGTGAHYRFASRFHPDTGTLVHHAAFPAWIWQVLNGDHASDVIQPGDQRGISRAQRSPVRHDGPLVRESKPISMRLHTPLWMLAFFLFIIERWTAHRQNP